MKKIVSILLSIILLLGLTACGEDRLQMAEVIEVNTAQDSESYVFGEDYQQNWNDWASGFGQLAAASKDGYYYYNMFGDGLLHFYDFATKTDVVVCNQPNCAHDSAECNAVLAGMGMLICYIQYYDGNLYCVGTKSGLGQDVCVYRVSADGSERGMVGTIMTLPSDGSVFCVVHRGYLYCALTLDEPSNKRETSIYRISLAGGADAEVIHTFDAAYGAGAHLKAYGNYLYICHEYYADRDGNGYKGDIYGYQIHTGEIEFITECGGKPFVVDERFIYYSTASQVLAYDMESKETIALVDQGPMFLTLDGNRLYCDNRFYIRLMENNNYDLRNITVIDTDTFEAIATIPLTRPNSFFAGTCGTDLLADTTYDYYRLELDLAMAGEEAVWEIMN